MKFKELEIPGVWLIEPDVHKDERGYFCETFSQKEFDEHVGHVEFVQDNESVSRAHTVRGLHFQKDGHAQAKLVRVAEGTINDVVVDMRKDSPTFGKFIKVRLSEANRLQLYIPRGCAHGFETLSYRAKFIYKCDNLYCREYEGGINPLDEELNIGWDTKTEEMVLSEKDRLYPDFKDSGYYF